MPTTARSRDPLISAEELAAELGSVRVIDMRWSLADAEGGRKGYEAGHIPGAVFVDMDREITGPNVGLGRHPLPSREQLQDNTGFRVEFAADMSVTEPLTAQELKMLRELDPEQLYTA